MLNDVRGNEIVVVWRRLMAVGVSDDNGIIFSFRCDIEKDAKHNDSIFPLV